MKNVEISKTQFNEILKQINVPQEANKTFLFKAYNESIETANEMIKSNILGKTIPINSIVILLYLINEYCYMFLTKKLKENEDNFYSLISVSLDKYFTNEHLNFKNTKFTSKFSPNISSLETYYNLMLGILQKFPQNNPRETLLVDIANKALKISQAIIELLNSGFETEAFSTWRTLHETECILSIISMYGDPVIRSYLKHMNYGIAFRGGISKEKTDKVFEQIKAEMKCLDLKSKDMKKFIEYGWLTSVKDYQKFDNFKFNFRDGVERIAGLESYSKVYEMASEFAHSSPLLIYSKKSYFSRLTILNLYESFFRVEKIFCSIYLPNIKKEEADRFLKMRNVYYPMIIDHYEREKEIFKNINKKRAVS